ncbi:MAG: hypothetical protein ACJA0U_003111, partial [Salibacteraceae bacterium]
TINNFKAIPNSFVEKSAQSKNYRKECSSFAPLNHSAKAHYEKNIQLI